jgi:ferritin
MVSKRLEAAINKQINAELWSAYLYLSMSMHFNNEGLPGVANWFLNQFKEEQDHAHKFMNYMNAKGNRVELTPIEKVDTSWKSVLHAFEETLKHERVVTQLINELVTIAKVRERTGGRGRDGTRHYRQPETDWRQRFRYLLAR